MQHRRDQHQEQRDPLRFLWVLLIIVAALAAIYFYVIPFLSSGGIGGGSSNFSGWSEARQRQIAFDLAQNVQNYRHRINEHRRINYGDAYMEATGISNPFRPPNPFDGMDSPSCIHGIKCACAELSCP